MRRATVALASATLTLAGAATGSPTHAADETPTNDLPVRAVVVDRVGDTTVSSDTVALARRADVRRVAYRTPSRADGTITVRITWQRLRDGDRSGTLPQRTTTVVTAGRGRTWAVVTKNRRDAAQLYELRPGVDVPPPMTPELLTVDHAFGDRGTTTVTVSTEWLPGRRAALRTFTQAGWDRSVHDHTDERVLRVGPRR